MKVYILIVLILFNSALSELKAQTIKPKTKPIQPIGTTEYIRRLNAEFVKSGKSNDIFNTSHLTTKDMFQLMECFSQSRNLRLPTLRNDKCEKALNTLKGSNNLTLNQEVLIKNSQIKRNNPQDNIKLNKKQHFEVKDFNYSIYDSVPNGGENPATQAAIFSSQFSEVLIHLDEGEKFANLTEHSPKSDLERELVNLVNVIEEFKRNHKSKLCYNIEELSQKEIEKTLISQKIRQNNQLDVSNINNIFFDIPRNKLKKIEAFKLKIKGKTYQLFRDKRFINSNDWLVSYKDKNGVIQYRKFIIQNAQEKLKHDSTFIDLGFAQFEKSKLKKGRVKTTSFLFRPEIGVSRLHIPFYRTLALPNGRISLAKLRMTAETQRYLRKTDLRAEVGNVSVTNTIHSKSQDALNATIHLAYKPTNGKWNSFVSIGKKNIQTTFSTNGESTNIQTDLRLNALTTVNYTSNFKNANIIGLNKYLKKQNGILRTELNIGKQTQANMSLIIFLGE